MSSPARAFPRVPFPIRSLAQSVLCLLDAPAQCNERPNEQASGYSRERARNGKRNQLPARSFAGVYSQLGRCFANNTDRLDSYSASDEVTTAAAGQIERPKVFDRKTARRKRRKQESSRKAISSKSLSSSSSSSSSTSSGTIYTRSAGLDQTSASHSTKRSSSITDRSVPRTGIGIRNQCTDIRNKCMEIQNQEFVEPSSIWKESNFILK